MNYPHLKKRVVHQVHASLEDMGLVSKEGIGNYVINDIFLAYALRNKDALLPLDAEKETPQISGQP